MFSLFSPKTKTLPPEVAGIASVREAIVRGVTPWYLQPGCPFYHQDCAVRVSGAGAGFGAQVEFEMAVGYQVAER